MDPHAAWQEMINCMIDGDYPEAAINADALIKWTENGGFFEMTVGGRKAHVADVKEVLHLIKCGINWIEERS